VGHDVRLLDRYVGFGRVMQAWVIVPAQRYPVDRRGKPHHGNGRLGGFAQAAAFGLQAYQGGSAAEMVRMNSLMYDITVTEHPDFKIHYFGFRGTPVGIDVFRVVDNGTQPVIDGGLAGKNGGQIGAGILRAPVECFTAAADAYGHIYG
jgi:hypothetical protein